MLTSSAPGAALSQATKWIFHPSPPFTSLLVWAFFTSFSKVALLPSTFSFMTIRVPPAIAWALPAARSNRPAHSPHTSLIRMTPPSGLEAGHILIPLDRSGQLDERAVALFPGDLFPSE